MQSYFQPLLSKRSNTLPLGMKLMVEGILTVTSDPAIIGFESPSIEAPVTKHCSSEEMRSALIKIGALNGEHKWPIIDFFIKVPHKLTQKELLTLGLAVRMKAANTNQPANQNLCQRKLASGT